MQIVETIRQSLESLQRNRLRSALTMTGIAWGLVTVVLLLSYGSSLGAAVLNGFLGIGNNVVMVWGGQTSMQSGGERAGKKIKLTLEDLEAVQQAMPLIRAVSAESDGAYSFKWQSKAVNIQTKAIDLAYGGMRKLNVEEGRYFQADDFTQRRHVCIFGPHAAQKLFNGYPAVGQSVLINGHSFEVIGVLKNKIQDSSNNGPDVENVFFPFQLLREIDNTRDPSSIVFQPLTAQLHTRATQAVRAIIAERHHFNPNDKKALPEWDTVEDSKDIMQFGLALQVMLGIIGAMTLLVGGIGVMNIMLVSVTERTREIGLMKALGARKRDIRRQFLLEALTLTLLAGGIGFIASLIIPHLIPPMPLYSSMYKTANHEGDIVLSPSMAILGASFLILAAVGILSGLIPAMRASALDPVEALRHE